ncbi:hypothetical protein K1719_035572 [Acacia pycnantha]|nr:hypothetical protein K1719_035572 [Acacia pycnantha]
MCRHGGASVGEVQRGAEVPKNKSVEQALPVRQKEKEGRKKNGVLSERNTDDPSYCLAKQRSSHNAEMVIETTLENIKVKSVNMAEKENLHLGEGPTSKGFAAVLRDMKRRYRLDMVVILEPRENKDFRKRQFRFEAAWQMYDGFEEVLRNSWKGREVLYEKLATLQQDLVCWNKEVFGKIEGRKRRILDRLDGIQRSVGMFMAECRKKYLLGNWE